MYPSSEGQRRALPRSRGTGLALACGLGLIHTDHHQRRIQAPLLFGVLLDGALGDSDQVVGGFGFVEKSKQLFQAHRLELHLHPALGHQLAILGFRWLHIGDVFLDLALLGIVLQERKQAEPLLPLLKLLEQREQGFSLFAFLEQNADESEVKEHIAYMKPSETQGGELVTQSRVEMKLQAVSLEQLLNFLDKSEAPNNLVGIAKCTIQENTKEEGSLDATLVMISVDQTRAANQR